MSGKLLKDLPTLGGGGLSGSEVLPISSDGVSVGKTTVENLRTLPSGKMIRFLDSNGSYQGSIDAPEFGNGDKQVRMFIKSSSNDSLYGFYLRSEDLHPLFWTGTASYSLQYIINQSYGSSSWYRVWSDGWIEQGGQVDSPAGVTNQNYVITLPIPFTNNNYYFNRCTRMDRLDGGKEWYIGYRSKTTTTVTVTQEQQSFSGNFIWYACGK